MPPKKTTRAAKKDRLVKSTVKKTEQTIVEEKTTKTVNIVESTNDQENTNDETMKETTVKTEIFKKISTPEEQTPAPEEKTLTPVEQTPTSTKRKFEESSSNSLADRMAKLKELKRRRVCRQKRTILFIEVIY